MGFGGALELESRYSSSQVPTTVKQIFPWASSPGLCLLAFSTLILTVLVATNLLSTSCVYTLVVSIFSCFVLTTFSLLSSSMLLYYQSFLLCVSHSNIPQEDRIGSVLPSPEKDLSINQVLQPGYFSNMSRGDSCPRTKHAGGSSNVRLCLQKGRDTASIQSLEAWPGKWQFANCTEEAWCLLSWTLVWWILSRIKEGWNADERVANKLMWPLSVTISVTMGKMGLLIKNKTYRSLD